MKIADLLQEELVLPRIRAGQKAGVIRELAAWLADHHAGVSQDEINRVLTEREKLGSTAIGEGVAIPHGKLEFSGGLIACMGRSQKGIDFGSADGAPTHLFFVLIAPARSAGDHLKALAAISRLFNNVDLRSRLMAAKTAREMYEIIAAEKD